jgi:hypothetical protein
MRYNNILYIFWLYDDLFVVYNIIKIAELDCCQIKKKKIMCTIYKGLHMCPMSTIRFTLQDR